MLASTDLVDAVDVLRGPNIPRSLGVIHLIESLNIPKYSER